MLTWKEIERRSKDPKLSLEKRVALEEIIREKKSVDREVERISRGCKKLDVYFKPRQ